MAGKSDQATKKEGRSGVQRERLHFRSLMAANPNYFGNLPDSGFEVVNKIVADVTYEEMTCLGYSPERKSLEATVQVKRPSGYGGGACDVGSREFVRFYVDAGSGWQDLGVVATSVHDFPDRKDCEGKRELPFTYALTLPYTPPRRTCRRPQLPLVRAILSWNVEPPANQPDWPPVWGNVLECHIQIDKAFSLGAVIDTLVIDNDLKIPADLLEQIQPVIDNPLPQPDPPPLSVAELGALYGSGKEAAAKDRFAIEPHRFGFEHLEAYALASDLSVEAYTAQALNWKDIGLDLSDLLVEVEQTKGNVSYEELECLGLDNNRDQLVATFRVKKAGGYSGGLCTRGSTEYVAFWADWKDTCEWTYLGTVEVKAYDFGDSLFPDGGLCYAAVLPVDLSRIQRPCTRRVVGRVRAVLSWNLAPSVTDPDRIPHWGNRIDAHVQVRPGRKIGRPFPDMTVIGGIAVEDINDVTGMTGTGAKFVDNGYDADELGRPCPFAQRVVVRGVQFPGHRYRVQVREVGTATWTTLLNKIWVTPVVGSGSYHFPDPDGWFSYLGHSQNFAGVLAYFETTGNEKWQIRIIMEGVFGQESQVIQLDNTPPEASVEITSGGGDCGMFTPGSTIAGRFVARDLHFRSYSLQVKGHPSANLPNPHDGSTQTPVAGSTWTLHTRDMAECGYIIEVVARDRAIRNSIASGWYASASIGFCLREQ